MMAEKVAQTGSGRRGSGGEKAGITSKTVVHDCGHLVAFEKPRECAEVATTWLAKSLKTWEERRIYERESRDNKSIDNFALSEGWKQRAKRRFDEHKGRCKANL
jgi:hypothetical protein